MILKKCSQAELRGDQNLEETQPVYLKPSHYIQLFNNLPTESSKNVKGQKRPNALTGSQNFNTMILPNRHPMQQRIYSRTVMRRRYRNSQLRDTKDREFTVTTGYFHAERDFKVKYLYFPHHLDFLFFKLIAS